MKKITLISLVIIVFISNLISQAPNLMSYQAVIWDGSGNLVAEKMVSIKISILQGSVTGTSIYSETHRLQTNINGLVSLMIGGGTNATGKISDINWGSGSYFLKTETDPTGGVNFSITGTTQLVSVPYSLYSGLAGNISTKNTGLPGQTLTIDKDGKMTWVSNLPTISTNVINDIKPNSSVSGGNVVSDGGSPVTARGVVWSTNSNPTISLSTKTSDGLGMGNFTSNLTGLSSNTTYYVRAYATNGVGTSYGNELTFTTVANIPTLTTTNIQSITSNSAITGGIVSTDGGSSVTTRGVVWSTNSNPTISLSTKTNDGIGLGTFNSNISGLSPNTTYYVRAYATNSAGSGYGNEISFKTQIGAIPPSVITATAKDVSYITFTSGGEVTFDGGAGVTARGIVWSQTVLPTVSLSTKTVNGSGNGTFTSYMFDLTPNTVYYVRAYATNSAGTGYGKLDTIRTRTWVNCPSTVKDIDNNVYNVVTIDYQCWTKENLKVSRYRNGDGIPVIVNNKIWESLTSGIRCWYLNDSTTYAKPYGNLYNWYSVSDSRGLCPTGWHIPNDIEWSTLIDYLGGESIAGGKIKTTGPDYWSNPNIATNSSGFSALPNGYRDQYGFFYNVSYERNIGILWSASESINSKPISYILENWNTKIFIGSQNKSFGASVRCLRDVPNNSISVITNPIITTSIVSSITSSTSLSGGIITSDGGSSITNRGIVWSTSPAPTISLSTKTTDGVGNGSFTSTLNNLKPKTTYYVRAYASNSAGTGYGNEITFTTLDSINVMGIPCPGTTKIKDFDGNEYNTVQIGTQCWMKENLRVTKYRDGSFISLDTTGGVNGNGTGQTWSARTTGARTAYEHNNNNLPTYGYLYNWYAASDSRNICPSGWHVPSDDEWTKLTDFLGGSTVAGGKLKSEGTFYWNSPNLGATNESGFSGLPGGNRYFNDGNFYQVNNIAFFWSASEFNINTVWTRALHYNISSVLKDYNNKFFGASVRCLRD